MRLPAWSDALADGIVLVDGATVSAVNAAAAGMLEVDPARVVGAALIAVVRDHRLEALRPEDGPREFETRGRRLEALAFAGGLRLRDVTPERRAQEDARELLAVLSHELRTPVTTIRSALEALAFDLPRAQQERFLAHAQGEAERLVRLLDDLTVDVAPPRARSVPLRDVGARVGALLERTLGERRVRVRFDLPTGSAWADPDKLLQALLNLVENAAVHGPPEGEVRCAAEADAERAGWWRVEVFDRGPAVPSEEMESWFAPHARGDGATGRGTGLGLYVVRSIAERWGGAAWARRWAGGNAFGFSVPRERSAALRTV